MGLLGNGLMPRAGLGQGQLRELNPGEGDSGTLCTKQVLKGVLIPHRRGGGTPMGTGTGRKWALRDSSYRRSGPSV